MKNKLQLLLITGILISGSVFANNGNGSCNGAKDKKGDPDMVGTITFNETGKPIRDVSVSAYSISKKEKVAISDANGNFLLADLKPGVYKLVFQKDGYQKVVREKIVLKTNEEFQLNIQMAEDESIFDLMPSPFKFIGVD